MPELFEPFLSRLENGLRVVSLRLPGASTVGAVLSVDTGGADEPDAVCGISHFLEHLVFRATEQYASSPELGAAIEGVGGYFNAFTSKTVTAYLAAAPLEHLDLAASIPAQLAVHPLLRAADIDDERPVVLREISLSEDSATRRALQALERLVWPGTGYARPILGFPNTLEACTAEPVHTYWKQRYRPDRAVFAFGGDLEHDDARRLASALAGSWKTSAASPNAATPDSAGTLQAVLASTGRLHVEAMDRQRVELWLGAGTAGFADVDRAEIEAVAALAAGGKGSRLLRVLLQERGLVLRASAFHWLHRSAGMLAASATVQPDRARDAVRALIDEVVSLASASDAECYRAIAYARGEYARSWAEPLGSATRLAEEALWLPEAPSRAAESSAFAALTPDKVRNAAARLWTRDTLCLAVVGPGVERDQFASVLAAAA